jgi:hypothetical protein
MPKSCNSCGGRGRIVTDMVYSDGKGRFDRIVIACPSCSWWRPTAIAARLLRFFRRIQNVKL